MLNNDYDEFLKELDIFLNRKIKMLKMNKIKFLKVKLMKI